MIVSEPTMDGFEWSPAAPFVPTQPGEDGWCVRDALCQLFEWEIGTEEWSRFIEAPEGRDIPRLAEHLGLTVFELPREWNDLIAASAHPGVALFLFHADRKSHTVYVHDIRWLLHHWPASDGLPAGPIERPLRKHGWPLCDQHIVRGPELGAVIVDKRLPPRPA
jgi:hypothetical protein